MATIPQVPDGARIAGTLLLLAALLAGCASPHRTVRDLEPLSGQPVPVIAVPDFTQVTPAMAAFLEQNVPAEGSRDKRAWSLVWAATDRNVLAFDYDPSVTLTPAETFDRRTGNCLSFSLMFVAMARHLGLNAWYQQVEIPPQWDAARDTLLVSMHINVVLENGPVAWVVDVSGETSARSRRLRKVPDHEAAAQYLNNLGGAALTRADLGKAWAYFAAALRLAPGLSYVWSNLGVVYNRNGQVLAAAEAHRTALDIDPGNTIAANNLFVLYEQQGEFEAAMALQARVDRHRRNNPYYLMHLSAEALAEGRLADSRELLQQAIELKGREYRFHYELARTLAAEGDLAAAENSLARAVALAPEDALGTNLQVQNLPELSSGLSY